MIFGLSVAASAEQGVTYRDVRSIGMGNVTVADGKGSSAFVNNPALLSRVQGIKFTIPNFPIVFNEDLWDMGNFIKDNRSRFENFDELSTAEKESFLKDMEPYDGKWARVNVSPMVSIAGTFLGNSIGVAVYQTDDVSFKIDRGIYEPRVWGEGVTNTVAAVGFARPLTMLVPGLRVGVNLKYIDRRSADLFQIKASDLGNIEDTVDPIIDEANDNSTTHFAVDLGALMTVPLIESEVGATIQNFGYGRNAHLDLGIVKRLFNERLALQADYIDFFDNHKENVFKKVHFGGEYDLGPLEVRAGVSSGYPNVGAGIDLRVLRLDFAYFTDELSKEPGGESDRRMAGQIQLGW